MWGDLARARLEAKGKSAYTPRWFDLHDRRWLSMSCRQIWYVIVIVMSPTCDYYVVLHWSPTSQVASPRILICESKEEEEKWFQKEVVLCFLGMGQFPFILLYWRWSFSLGIGQQRTIGQSNKKRTTRNVSKICSKMDQILSPLSWAKKSQNSSVPFQCWLGVVMMNDDDDDDLPEYNNNKMSLYWVVLNSAVCHLVN